MSFTRTKGMVAIDPGHGMSNRRADLYDPGAVAKHDGVEEQEAFWALQYGHCLAAALGENNVASVMTRSNKTDSCSLWWRREIARNAMADLLVSLHLNADVTPGTSKPDGRLKGFNVIWRRPESERFAVTVASAMGDIPAYKSFWGALRHRENLSVLRYRPSILIELGFLDDPDDFELLKKDEWMYATCSIIARAVAGELGRK